MLPARSLVAPLLAWAFCFVGCATASPNPIVLTQAPLNPLSGASALRVMPVEEGPVSLESAFFAAPAAERRFPQPAAESVSPLSEPFERALVDQAISHGIRIVNDRDEKDAPFLVWPRVTSVEGTDGPEAFSELRMRVRITTAKGALVDEIAVRHRASGAHDRVLPRAAVENAKAVAEHLAARVLGRRTDDGACPAPERDSP